MRVTSEVRELARKYVFEQLDIMKRWDGTAPSPAEVATAIEQVAALLQRVRNATAKR